MTQAQAAAVSCIFAWELENSIAKENVSKTAMARSLNTNRSTVDRVIEPNNTNINL